MATRGVQTNPNVEPSCLLTGSDQQLDLSKPRFPHLLHGIGGNSLSGVVLKE